MIWDYSSEVGSIMEGRVCKGAHRHKDKKKIFVVREEMSRGEAQGKK